MKGDEAQLRENIRERFLSTTEFAPNEIQFHSWEEMRGMQGVGKELKEKKVVDHRPKKDPGNQTPDPRKPYKYPIPPKTRASVSSGVSFLVS